MENFMNKLTDMEWSWWPFIKLRPSKDQKMTTLHVAKMALYFGSLYGVFTYFIFHAQRYGFNIIQLIIYTILFIIMFFVFYRLTFAYFWNVRATRISFRNDEIS